MQKIKFILYEVSDLSALSKAEGIYGWHQNPKIDIFSKTLQTALNIQFSPPRSSVIVIQSS